MTSLRVNGQTYQVDADPATPLLWVLRDILGLTGTKYGCGIEECGACMVLVGDSAEKSCHIELKDASSEEITTIEGLSTDRNHPVQKAWIAQQVPQCGYCQSGMIMRSAALLRDNPNPTDAQIDGEIENICACGTYQRIRAALHAAK